MNPPALVIFDIDGTLLDTTTVTVPAVQETLAAHGLPAADAKTICSFFGRPVEDYWAWLASLCPEGEEESFVDEANRRELAVLAEVGQLYPGAQEVLETMKGAGYALAICSNGPLDYVGTFVEAFGMKRYFEIILTRGMGYESKEQMIGDVLARIAARPVVVVGDRWDDIEGAHANGAMGIAALYGFGGPDEGAHADERVTSIKEVPGVVARLIAQPGGLIEA